MALQDIREIAVPITLDKPRTLRFDLNAFAELEEKFGSMDAAFQAMKKGSLKAARALLWAGLLHEDETLTEKGVGAMVGLQNIGGIMEIIADAMNRAMPETESAEPAGSKENPT